jgi:hypothetical protein
MAFDAELEARAKLKTTVLFYGGIALAAMIMGIVIYYSR